MKKYTKIEVILRLFQFKKRSLNLITAFIWILLVFCFAGCKKLVEVDGPKTSVSSADIYNKDITAVSVLTGLYGQISSEGIMDGGISSMSYLASLSSDELTLTSSDVRLTAFYSNTLNNENIGLSFWETIYPKLYIINSALEGISKSNTLTPAVKQQLLGEAKFMRAFCFFYLVNLYGDVPLVLSTDYKTNSLMSRTPKEKIWSQIIVDLKDAQELLSSDYLDASLLKSTEEKVRPTKWAATALLARTYLYIKEWKNAEDQATKILDNNYFGIVDLDQVFLKNSKEAIWQLQPVSKGVNTPDARVFITTSEQLSAGSVFLSSSLFNVFDLGDQRKNHWIGNVLLDGISYHYPYKYKVLPSVDINAPVYEYTTIFRVAEELLIRAEARIQQDNTSGGIIDLNILRNRANDKTALPNLQLKQLPTDMTKSQALLAVEKERQTEFFAEWGHRWLDLKRTNRVDEVMRAELPRKVSNGIWKSYQQWYPIGLYELQHNPNLVQNSGF